MHIYLTMQQPFDITSYSVQGSLLSHHKNWMRNRENEDDKIMMVTNDIKCDSHDDERNYRRSQLQSEFHAWICMIASPNPKKFTIMKSFIFQLHHHAQTDTQQYHSQELHPKQLQHVCMLACVQSSYVLRRALSLLQTSFAEHFELHLISASCFNHNTYRIVFTCASCTCISPIYIMYNLHTN